jgi:hypothetical protein
MYDGFSDKGAHSAE